MVSKADVDAFHAHLDACERCRTRPFDLCPEGEKLLVVRADAMFGGMPQPFRCGFCGRSFTPNEVFGKMPDPDSGHFSSVAATHIRACKERKT